MYSFPSLFLRLTFSQTAVSIHDSKGSLFDKFNLQGGDDASDAKWADYHPGMELYASHTNFMAIAYEYRRRELNN